MSFVRAPNPIWFMVDLVGEPLNDEYYAFFLTNTLPYLPQNVYRDPQGMTVWTGNVVQFFPNGTLPDNLYFDPNLVYRIEIRRGDSQTDPLIYEINNFVPPAGSATPGSNELFGNENQASNGQFSEISFTSPTTITTAGTHQVAPDWDLVLTGTGSTTLTQLILSGDAGQIGNPPYALRIANSGWSTAELRQRFEGNGALWAGGAVSMSVLAKAQTSSQLISLVYTPSALAGSSTTIVNQETVLTGDYQTIAGAVNIPASNNNQTSDTAYVDMIIVLPVNGTLDLSNIQIIGQSTPLTSSPGLPSDIPPYQQETNERMIDHLFHDYRDQLVVKPKDNLLVGWNFPLNPFQFTSTTITTIVPMTSYVADQTILHQEAASQVQSGRNTTLDRSNLVIKAVSAATTTRFALIQYIDPASIKPYWSYVLSAFARVKIATAHSTSVGLKCRLIYRASLPPTLANAEPISGWAADSDPTFAAGWTALVPLNDPEYIIPRLNGTDESVGGNSYTGFSFDQFQMPNTSSDDMILGIVLYTMDNLNSTAASEDYIGFERVSLIPSYFGADASPESFDECLSRCQYYYEKSFTTNLVPNNASQIFAEQYSTATGAVISGFTKGFGSRYNTIKRAIPSALTIYNANTGGSAAVFFQLTDDNGNGVTSTSEPIASWALLNSDTKGFSYKGAKAAAVIAPGSAAAHPEAYILYHFTADARLGV